MSEAPFVRGSGTSLRAAEAIAEGAPSLRRRVLRLIEASVTGMTDEEIQEFLDMNPSTERPRRVELVDAGLVMDSGRRRNTRSGRKAVVWIRCERFEVQELPL